MVIAALAMTALLLFAALAIDVGLVWSSRDAEPERRPIRGDGRSSDDDRDVRAPFRRSISVAAQQTGYNYGAVELDGRKSAGDRPQRRRDGRGRRFHVRILEPPEPHVHAPQRCGPERSQFSSPRVRANVLMDDAVNKQSPTFLHADRAVRVQRDEHRDGVPRLRGVVRARTSSTFRSRSTPAKSRADPAAARLLRDGFEPDQPVSRDCGQPADRRRGRGRDVSPVQLDPRSERLLDRVRRPDERVSR